MSDIWSLYEQHYGAVPSELLDELKKLEREHTLEQIAEAFEKARGANQGEGAPFGYVAGCLAKMGKAAPRQPLGKSDRLPCYDCEIPTYLDNMTTRTVLGVRYGVCSPCAKAIDEACPGERRDRAYIHLGTARLVEAYWQSVTKVPA